jgi:PII-like signaling protein
MLSKGPAKKVTIYVNEDTRHHAGPLWNAVFLYLQHKKVAGATVLRPLMGFGTHHRRHSLESETTMEHMPVRIEFVDSEERVNEVLPTLYDMVRDGLIEVQDTSVIKSVTERKTGEEVIPRTELRGPAKMMRIYLGEADRWHDEPLHEAILKRLRMMDIAGATVYRGILGYGAKGHSHKKHFLHISEDLPLMISVVDKPEKIEEAIAAVSPMMGDALIVLSEVDVIRLSHGMPAEAAAVHTDSPVD